MKQDEIIEMAIQGHASTRDAIRWAIKQEREACLKICDEFPDIGYVDKKLTCDYHSYLIRLRGEA